MKVKDVTFRSLLARPILVRYDASRLFEGHDTLSWPDGADAILGYGYYDRQAGLNLDIMAPARFEDQMVYHDSAPLLTAKIRMMLRPGTYDDCEMAVLPDDAEKEVLELYGEQCVISDSYWTNDSQLVAMLRLEEIDHLRHPQYALDVQVGLIIESEGIELVWVRLEGLSNEGLLLGELLNTPCGKSDAVAGDIVVLGVTKDSEGTLRLFTRDSMIIDARGQRRNEEC